MVDEPVTLEYVAWRIQDRLRRGTNLIYMQVNEEVYMLHYGERFELTNTYPDYLKATMAQGWWW